MDVWAFIRSHHDELQALGPVATIFAYVVAALVAGVFGFVQYRLGRAQRDIAAAQRDIAQRRLRLDLHLKRYEIYSVAHNVLLASLGGGYKRKEDWDLAVIKLAEAKFFFSSRVMEFVVQITAMIPLIRNDYLVSEKMTIENVELRD